MAKGNKNLTLKEEIEKAQTRKDFQHALQRGGAVHDRTAGGHDFYYVDGKGGMPLSTHEKEFSPGMRHTLRKQMLRLFGLAVVFIGVPALMLWQAFSSMYPR